MKPCSRLLPALARAALLLALAACAAPKPPASPAQAEGAEGDSPALVPADQLSAAPFTVLQRVRGRYGTQEVAFECLVQLADGKLTVLGMTPHSPRAFVVEQHGSDVHAQSFMLRDVWFEPVQVLYDIHRAFFRGLAGAQTNGVHELQEHDELVRELWQRGHIVERRFHALDTFSSLVVIRFEGAPAPVIAPRIRLTNLHQSYSLVIENVEQKRLGEDFSLGVDARGRR